MGRNRKLRSNGTRVGPTLKAVLLCLFIGGAAVGYVYQKNQLSELGRQRRQRETELEKLRHQNAVYRRRLSELHSPRNLESEVRRLRLPLALPHPMQIVSLPAVSVPMASEPGARVEVAAADLQTGGGLQP